jgi:hypothetical protein
VVLTFHKITDRVLVPTTSYKYILDFSTFVPTVQDYMLGLASDLSGGMLLL